MDKSCHSSASDSSATASTSTHLRHLNKLSQKISKPPHNPLLKKPTFDPPPPAPQHTLNPQSQPQHNHTHSNLQQHQQHQPPVYNINKNDFRDVVQKLTGSPAHDRFSNPPPVNHPKPQSSRLQRIRPPPLAQLTNRPPPLLNCAPPPNLNPNHLNPSSALIHRHGAPLSPLPPLPAVHAAAESPVSAYMRYLHTSMAALDPNLKPFSGFQPPGLPLSPRWGSLTAPPPQQPPPGSSAGFGAPPLLPFGCLNSPRSPYALRSPNSGQFGIPLSPTVPVPSPTWRGL